MLNKEKYNLIYSIAGFNIKLIESLDYRHLIDCITFSAFDLAVFAFKNNITAKHD